MSSERETEHTEVGKKQDDGDAQGEFCSTNGLQPAGLE